MSRKLKGLGVSVVAALALCLVTTSIAAAASFTSGTGTYPTSFEATAAKGFGSFKTEAGETTCKATASGTLSAASSTATISTTYSECTSGFGMGATIKTEGCQYLVHIVSGSGDSYTGSGDLVCPEGKVMSGTSGVCEIQVPPQSGVSSIKLTNNTALGRIEGEITSSNVTYTVTKDPIGCPFNGTGHRTGGKITHSQPGFVGGTEKPVHIG